MSGPPPKTRGRQAKELTYEATVSSEERVPHLLLFTNRFPLNLHSEILISVLKQGTNIKHFRRMYF